MAHDHHNHHWNLVRSCLVFGSVKVITVISAMPATLIPTKASPWSGIANNRPELINAKPRPALYLLLCWLLPRPPYLNTTHAQSKTKDLDAWCNAKPETWLTKSFVFMVFFSSLWFYLFCIKRMREISISKLHDNYFGIFGGVHCKVNSAAEWAMKRFV